MHLTKDTWRHPVQTVVLDFGKVRFVQSSFLFSSTLPVPWVPCWSWTGLCWFPDSPSSVCSGFPHQLCDVSVLFWTENPLSQSAVWRTEVKPSCASVTRFGNLSWDTAQWGSTISKWNLCGSVLQATTFFRMSHSFRACSASIPAGEADWWSLGGAWEQPPRGAPGYQVLSDILFRFGLIANCSHTVQCLDFSNLNWRCNRYHLFWHGMTLLVLMCR